MDDWFHSRDINFVPIFYALILVNWTNLLCLSSWFVKNIWIDTILKSFLNIRESVKLKKPMEKETKYNEQSFFFYSVSATMPNLVTTDRVVECDYRPIVIDQSIPKKIQIE